MTDRRHVVLWGLFVLQAICAIYFVGDAIFDFLGWEHGLAGRESETMEYLLAAALVLSVGFTGAELLKLTRRDRDLTRQIGVASGEFAKILERQFDAWELTEAERNVAILAIKGFSVAEMADLRRTKVGTVKAQCASVYRKAGVSGRLQLLGLFIEDLVADDLVAQSRS